MPASMITAETDGMPNVNGNKRAVPAVGPSPGKTPTNMPKVTPIKAYKRFQPLAAVENPCNKKSRASIVIPLYQPNSFIGNGILRTVLKTKNTIPVTSADNTMLIFQEYPLENKMNNMIILVNTNPTYGTMMIYRANAPILLTRLIKDVPFGNKSENSVLFLLNAETKLTIAKTTSMPLIHIGNRPGPGPYSP